MSESAANQVSIQEDIFWANQFVPLPPTQFPDDGRWTGTDPFISPELLQTVSGEDPKSENAAGHKMEVEIIGQVALEPADSKVDDSSTIAAEAVSRSAIATTVVTADGRSSNDSMAIESSTSSYLEDATGTLQAQKIDKVGFENGDQTRGDADAGSDDHEMMDAALLKPGEPQYWGQFTQSNFVPGVTPTQSYPVCQEFKQNFSPDPLDAEPESPMLQPLADTDYFFLASEYGSPEKTSAGQHLDRLARRRTDESESFRHELGEQEASEALDVTDCLPQLPCSDSSAGNQLLDSVQDSLSQLHASIDAHGEDFCSEPIASALLASADAHVAPALELPDGLEELEAAASSLANADEVPSDEAPVAEQVIEVDGNDGFDFLDLDSFEPAQATFNPGQILLDAGTSAIRIQYKNVGLAIFANGVQVEIH